MPENELINVANNAEMIVNGYAFTKKDEGYSVLNLANPDKAMVISNDGSTVLQNRGVLTDREINKIQQFIKINYLEMFEKWSSDSNKGFFDQK